MADDRELSGLLEAPRHALAKQRMVVDDYDRIGRSYVCPWPSFIRSLSASSPWCRAARLHRNSPAEALHALAECREAEAVSGRRYDVEPRTLVPNGHRDVPLSLDCCVDGLTGAAGMTIGILSPSCTNL